MKVYIAGKITGDRRYRAKFREAAKALEAAGHVVLNPATPPDGLTDADYMRICMAMVDAADLAVFLPDYRESRGAMVEWAYCQRIGKDCALYLDMMGGQTRRKTLWRHTERPAQKSGSTWTPNGPDGRNRANGRGKTTRSWFRDGRPWKWRMNWPPTFTPESYT